MPESSEVVPAHRQELLLSLGFSEEQAYFLAIINVEMSAIEDLIKNGCSHELAVRILS